MLYYTSIKGSEAWEARLAMIAKSGDALTRDIVSHLMTLPMRDSIGAEILGMIASQP